MSSSKTQTLTDQLLNSIYCAVEIVIQKNTPIAVEFAPYTLTVEFAEIISNYLDDLSVVTYNFDARRGKLTLKPLPQKLIFFIDDTLSGRLH